MRSQKVPGLTNVSVNIIKLWYNLGFPKKGEPDMEARALWESVIGMIQRCWVGEIPKAFN